MADLSKRLGIPHAQAIGHLTALWEFASEFQKNGGIGAFSDEGISHACFWTGAPSVFITGLIESRWIDRDLTWRLGIHDWHQHCEDYVHKFLRENKIKFWNGAKPFSRKKVRVATQSEKVAPSLPCLALPCLATPKPSKTPPTPSVEGMFEKFWFAYPRKKSITSAERAFRKAIAQNKGLSEELLATMLSAIDRQKGSADWQRDNGQYIPYPATWLNNKCWLDEVNNERSKTHAERTADNIRLLQGRAN